ncbi:MAG: YciI family protein [Polyangiaceae bacterium]
MSEFLFLYRGGRRMSEASAQEMQETMQKWMVWMKGLGEKGHLKDAGHPLDSTIGKTVKGQKKTVTDGPYAEKDLVGGYSIITAKDLGQATELTAGCPIFEVDGIVEVRSVLAM